MGTVAILACWNPRFGPFGKPDIVGHGFRLAAGLLPGAH